MEKQYFTGKDLNALRRELRKLLVAGRLEIRETYRDFYDSCHPPTETPNAEFKPIVDIKSFESDLKAGQYKPSFYLIASGIYGLSYFGGNIRCEIRITQGGAK